MRYSRAAHPCGRDGDGDDAASAPEGDRRGAGAAGGAGCSARPRAVSRARSASRTCVRSQPGGGDERRPGAGRRRARCCCSRRRVERTGLEHPGKPVASRPLRARGSRERVRDQRGACSARRAGRQGCRPARLGRHGHLQPGAALGRARRRPCRRVEPSSASGVGSSTSPRPRCRCCPSRPSCRTALPGGARRLTRRRRGPGGRHDRTAGGGAGAAASRHQQASAITTAASPRRSWLGRTHGPCPRVVLVLMVLPPPRLEVPVVLVPCRSFSRRRGAPGRPDGADQDEEVEPQRPVVDVPQVEADRLRPAEVRATRDLPQAGDAGLDDEPAPRVDVVAGDLARQRRPRTDERHVAPHDVPQLRAARRASTCAAAARAG